MRVMIFMTMFRRGSLSCPSLDVASGSLLVPPNPCQSPPQYTSKVIIVIKSLISLVITCHKPSQKLWPTVQVSRPILQRIGQLLKYRSVSVFTFFCLQSFSIIFFCNLSCLYQSFSKLSYKNNLLQIFYGLLFANKRSR